ncbi:MAG: M28 family metallopeptidase, partial [Candidatus Hodarchaeales archaeon]
MLLIPQKIRSTLLFWLFISAITIVTGNILLQNSLAVDFKDLSGNFSELSDSHPTMSLHEFIDFGYYGDLISEEYFENINDHIDNFSSFGSRVTGYPGYEHAISYIEDFFKNQNLLRVKTLSYPLQIPYDHGTKITINGENFTAHALAPNSVHTSKILGLSGTLIYGGFGTYSELDGKKIEESIVVLEFNSRDNWINVASLGAGAIIYLPPEDTNRYEAELKTLDIPLNFPRIYINNVTTANTIKKLSSYSNQSITLYSDIEWVSIQAKNVMGLLPGLDDDVIIISAHFDSISVVPSIAPGADEACGIATLLELIHLMRDENITPQKTIMFLALSGHNQAAAGAREFISQNYDILNAKEGIKLFLSLDLSASNNKVGINPYGHLYKFQLGYTLGNNLYARLKNIGEDFLVNYAATIREVTGYSFEVESYINLQEFEYIAPISFIGDHEPFIASNVLGLSFYTAESHRWQFNTPFDLPNYLQPEMLKSQVVYSVCALVQLFNEENLGNYLDLTNKDFSLILNMHVGFGNIEGYCKEYDKTTSLLTNVANAVIRVISRDKNTDIQGGYPYYTTTDESGFYQVRGISSSQADNPLEFSVEAYSFDFEGRLTKANDLGEYGEFFTQSKKLVEKEIAVNPTVFRCGTIGLFGISHPIDQLPAAELLDYQILDPTTQNLFLSYGYLGIKSVSLVFIPPNTPSILVGDLPAGVLGVYATNSSTSTLRGNGFLVEEGGYKNLGISAFVTSKDLLSLSQTYIDTYTSHNIYDNQVQDTFQRASTLIDSAIQLKKNFEYSEAIKTISEAHIWSYDSFNQSRSVIAGGISSALLIAILLIPFSLMMSLLLFNFNSWKKWAVTISLIYTLTVSFSYIIHPAFQIIPHLLFTLIGLINLVFVFPVLFFLGQEGYLFLKNQRTKLLGSHFSEMNRISAILIAIKTGVSRMKKHKIRTLLTLSGISL